MAERPTFVLVHGGYHDGGAWAETQRHLDQLGYASLAPTLAGHGADGRGDANHADQVDSVERAIDEADSPVILLGHSYAGCVIQKAAERRPERIARLIFCGAFVMLSGESPASATPPGIVDPDAKRLAAAHERAAIPPFEAMAALFFNDMPRERALAAYETLSPSPTIPLHENIDLSKFFELEIPQTVLVGIEDLTMPDGYKYHPYYSSRLNSFDLWEMPGSHELMFSNPQGLAEKLVEICVSHDSVLSGQ